MLPVGTLKPITRPGDRFYWVEGCFWIGFLFAIGILFFYFGISPFNLVCFLLGILMWFLTGLMAFGWWYDEQQYLGRGGMRKPLTKNKIRRPKPRNDSEMEELRHQVQVLEREVRALEAKGVFTEYVKIPLDLARSFVMCNVPGKARHYIQQARKDLAELKEGKGVDETPKPVKVEPTTKPEAPEELI